MIYTREPPKRHRQGLFLRSPKVVVVFLLLNVPNNIKQRVKNKIKP